MLYNKHLEIGRNVKNLGFDYHGKILKKSLSPVLFRNLNVGGFLELMENIFSDMVDSVKHIKKFHSYTHKKDSIDLN